MARVQATLVVHKVEVKKVGNKDLNVVKLMGWERTYSTSRKRAHERDGQEAYNDVGRPGQYSLWFPVEVFVPDRGIERFKKLKKGDIVDVMGQLNEDVWLGEDNVVQKRYVISQPDVKQIYFPDGNKDGGQRSSSSKSQGADEQSGWGLDDDEDLPI